MPRSKVYDREEVLRNAVDVFWQKGYKACSVADLVHSTGLNTASMYKEFGDKDGLFVASLEYYRQHILANRLDALAENPNLQGIESFLQSVINGAVKKTYRGCLMMNHLSQIHTIAPEAAKKLDQFRQSLERLLARAIANAQKAGDIQSQKDPEELASYLACFVHGLVLYGRHPKGKKAIPALRDSILRALN
jgi:TetR/AcrR family transcriptional repressor of nem operon